jgi:hypothetical protein
VGNLNQMKEFNELFFRKLDRATRDCNLQSNLDNAERALYLLLNSDRSKLPYIDVDNITDFHKTFRQQDVYSSVIDMTIWHLLHINGLLELVKECAIKAYKKESEF